MKSRAGHPWARLFFYLVLVVTLVDTLRTSRASAPRFCCLLIMINGAEYQRAQRPANEWSNPEKPKLLQCPPANEQSRTRAARWIDAGVGDRDADQVDQRKA